MITLLGKIQEVTRGDDVTAVEFTSIGRDLQVTVRRWIKVDDKDVRVCSSRIISGAVLAHARRPDEQVASALAMAHSEVEAETT